MKGMMMAMMRGKEKDNGGTKTVRKMRMEENVENNENKKKPEREMEEQLWRKRNEKTMSRLDEN